MHKEDIHLRESQHRIGQMPNVPRIIHWKDTEEATSKVLNMNEVIQEVRNQLQGATTGLWKDQRSLWKLKCNNSNDDG